LFKRIHQDNLSSAAFIVCIVIALRIFTLGTSDLIDPTESRYAFVAQEMVLSADWITPKLQLPEGLEAYTGKPPLHFWLTAIAISIFGMDAWVSRIPSLLAMFVIGYCVWIFPATEMSKRAKALAVMITMTAGLFFFISGSSTIDLTFSAGISAAITSFALAGQALSATSRRIAGYAFFIALACAFLTKGPASFIIIGATIFFWMLKKSHWPLFPALPWISGTLLFLLISSPWFILCAYRNPGFLHYFFIQENFLRFVSTNYGDRFGTGHVHPRGSALWMLVVGFLPWSLLFAALLLRSKQCLKQIREFSPWTLLALSWGLAPTLFFCFARQLHAAYLLPGFAGLAIILAKLIEAQTPDRNLIKILRIFRLLTIAAATITLITSLFFNVSVIAFLTSLPLLAALYLVNRDSLAEPKSLLQPALTWSLLVCIFYSITLISFGPHASMIKSTRYALSQIIPELTAGEDTINFLSHNTYSLYYYPRKWTAEHLASVETSFITFEQLAEKLPKNLLLNKTDVKSISPEIASQYQERKNFGKWRWWQKVAS
jgi:4-amino-4-deoxy-L-arabinose transferase-like glycosyltransferase